MENSPQFTPQQLLQQCGLPEMPFLGAGMQCMVFADGTDRAIKIYNNSIGIANLQRLQQFYDSLNTAAVSFSVPKILAVNPLNDKIIVTEERLPGVSLTRQMQQQMPGQQLRSYFQQYTDTLFQLQQLTTAFLSPGEPLDQSGDFFAYGHYGSWQHLLTANLERKLAASGDRYRPFIHEMETLTAKIFAWLKTLPVTQNSLLHGDFFPANTLVNEEGTITAVLDFGTFTALGDPLYDIGLGWMFADMYHDVQHLDTKQYVGDLVMERLTSEETGRMKCYILVYSILSADMYGSADVNDGHFRWAMHNLNDENLLEAV